MGGPRTSSDAKLGHAIIAVVAFVIFLIVTVGFLCLRWSRAAQRRRQGYGITRATDDDDDDEIDNLEIDTMGTGYRPDLDAEA